MSDATETTKKHRLCNDCATEFNPTEQVLHCTCGEWLCEKCAPDHEASCAYASTAQAEDGAAVETTKKNAWSIDVDKWFGLRKPTEAQKYELDMIRGRYIHLATTLLDTCPANPDRTHAIRQLKESMHTAITAIVCADTWDTLPGPKGD